MSVHKSETNTGRFEASFLEMAKERETLEPEQLWQINIDVPTVVNAIIGATTRIEAMSAQIHAELPNFKMAKIKKLQTYAEGLAFAQTSYVAAAKPIEALPELVARGIQLRDQLQMDATTLAHRALVDGRPLEELKGGNGFLNVGYDVGILVRFFRGNWEKIKGKTAVQAEELDEAQGIFESIALANAERSKQPLKIAAASEDRQRAYSLAVGAYDQVRRALIYVRWDEDDVDSFAPSLFAGRGGRGSAPKAAASGDSSGAAPGAKPTPVVTPVATAPANGAVTTPVAPVASTTPVTPGMPNGAPFTNN